MLMAIYFKGKEPYLTDLQGLLQPLSFGRHTPVLPFSLCAKHSPPVSEQVCKEEDEFVSSSAG